MIVEENSDICGQRINVHFGNKREMIAHVLEATGLMAMNGINKLECTE